MSTTPHDSQAPSERDGADDVRAEESARAALPHLRSIIDTVREPLLVLDGRLRVKSANRSFYRTFQVSPQETEGHLLYDLGNGQWDIRGLRTLLEEVLPENTSFDDFEVEHDFPDIGRKAMLLNARKLRHEGTEQILLAIEDVTERRRLEAERQAIETRFTSLVKNIRDHSIFTLDPEGRVTSWNVAAEHILGHTEAEVLGRHFAFIFTPDDRRQGVPEAELRTARETGRAEDERWHVRKGGERFWALGIVSALHDTDGRLIGYAKILRDMTDWKRSEQSLRDRELRYRTLVEATKAITWSCPPSGLHSEPQPAWMAFTGQSAEEMLGAGWTKMVHPDDLADAAERWTEAVVRGESFTNEHRIRRYDGQWRWMHVQVAPIRDSAGRIAEWIGMNLDITERKRAEEALARSEAKYRSLFQSIDEGFCIIEMIFDERDKPVDYRFLEVNPAFERHTGLVNACGKTIRELVPGHEQHWFDMFGRVALTGEATRYQNRAAQLHRWYDGYAWRYGAPQDRQVAVLFNDFTSRKQAAEALQEADRRKDAFLATLAHELRNPLAPIRTGLDLIRALPDDAAGTERALHIMDRQLTHLVRLVDDLLDVSRISRGTVELRTERLRLGEIIDAALEMSASGLGRGNRHLTVSVPSEPLAVEGDRVRLVQIVANLLTNAVKFTTDGGQIALSVIPRGDRVEIRVQDDGCGISRERLTGIFDLFCQVEPGRGGGLGIGLSLVQGLVALHGGTVHAESDGLGRGATFTVSLPLCPDAPAQAVPQQAGETEPMPRCRVLVVDDNHDITESLDLLLTTLQADVRVAHHGMEALRICEDWSPTHVLMDLGLPGMDGYETARRLCANHPDRGFRLIALSGWGSEEYRQRTRNAGFDQHLVKPVTLADIKALLCS